MNNQLRDKLIEWSYTEPIIAAAINTQLAHGLTDDDTLDLIITGLIQVQHNLTQKLMDSAKSPTIAVHCRNPSECWFKQRGEHTTPVETQEKYGQHS